MKFLIFLSFLLLSSCTNLFYQPTYYLYAPPEKFKLDYENRIIESLDGTRLHSWFFPNQDTIKKTKGLVVLFHGNAQNISSHYLSVVWLAKKGFDVLVWDYRGYGLSQGEPSLEGVHQDSVAILNYVHKMKEDHNYEKLVLIGQSLGGNILMRALKDDKKAKEISLVVLDSTFLSYEEIAKDRLQTVWFLYPVSFLAPLLVSDEYSPKELIKDYPYPAVILHSKKDTVIPFAFGEEVYSRWGGPKDFWISEEGGHIELLGKPDSDIQKKLLNRLLKD